MLFENVPFSRWQHNDIFVEEYIMRGISWVMEKIEATKEQYKSQKDIVTSRRLSLEQFLLQVDASIEKTHNEILVTENSVRVKQWEIGVKQTQMADLQKKIVKNKHVILEYLNYIYTKGDLLYDQNQNIDVLRGILMNDGDIQDMFSDIHYKGLVSQVGQQFVDMYRNLTRDYYRMLLSLDAEVTSLSELEKSLNLKRDELEHERAERSRILELTKWQEEIFAQYISSQENQIANAALAWKNAQDRYVAKFENLAKEYGCNLTQDPLEMRQECKDFRSFFQAERSLMQTATLIQSGTVNIFSWPVPTNRLSAFYRDPDYFSLLWSSHDAIDIPVPQGTAVRSVADGYIYYILPPTPGGYSYMAVKHANGMVSVYGHLSHIYGSLFQMVKKGDVIGLSGGIPGTPWAGPLTSWAHLHFEVWKNGTNVDPLRFLNIADIPFSSFPSRYNDKFVQDIQEKYGNTRDTSQYESNFKIRGETEDARQANLLTSYAAPAFRNRDIWITASLDAHIDPSFLMCVWLAETTLGNFMKTAYNIGNVGNTDDGSVRSFANVSEGINAMAKTFNNQYLSQYNTVSELSRWGNSRGLIYASSPENWHNNIIRCMSALKGRFVEDDYAFRLKPPTGL